MPALAAVKVALPKPAGSAVTVALAEPVTEMEMPGAARANLSVVLEPIARMLSSVQLWNPGANGITLGDGREGTLVTPLLIAVT